MSKEFEEWHKETTGSSVDWAGANCFNYSVEFVRSVWDAAESRGIAKGRIEGMREAAGIAMRMLHDTRVDWSVNDVHDAILSASQPQEIAGEGCVWTTALNTPACISACGYLWGRLRAGECPHCSKPIVIGGER